MHAVNGATEGRRSGYHCRKYGKVAAYRFQRLMTALVWPVATYGCESWTLRKNKETRLDAFGMKGLRKIRRVSWTAKKTNEWLLNKAGVKRELLDAVKARKLAYYGYTMRKQGSCLEKEIMQEQYQVHANEEDHARPGWTTSRRGQDSSWKSHTIRYEMLF